MVWYIYNNNNNNNKNKECLNTNPKTFLHYAWLSGHQNQRLHVHSCDSLQINDTNFNIPFRFYFSMPTLHIFPLNEETPINILNILCNILPPTFSVIQKKTKTKIDCKRFSSSKYMNVCIVTFGLAKFRLPFIISNSLLDRNRLRKFMAINIKKKKIFLAQNYFYGTSKCETLSENNVM